MNTSDKVISVASAEVGYLEKSKTAYKKNPAILDQKTAGAGSDNYTKYGRDMHALYPKVMDFPAAWCDCFVDWCFTKAYGVSNAKALLGGDFNDYTVASAQLYKDKEAYHKVPKIGDQIFFNNGTRICHTGIVEAVSSSKVYTIEGNTSSGSSLVANGGAVCKKNYPLNYYRIDGYGRPAYDKATDYSLVFDAAYYAAHNADLGNAGLTTYTQLIGHFTSYGMKEARQAIETFNPVVYRAANKDLQDAFGDDWEKYYKHYIQLGHNENRKTH